MIARFQSCARGFTFVELLFAITIGSMIALGLMSLVSIVAREQRVGFVSQRVFNRADTYQDKITRILQQGSRQAGVFLRDPSGAMFRQIVFREGEGFPNQSLTYLPSTGRLIHDPDTAVANNEIIIGGNNDGLVMLESVGFRDTIKKGGIPDSGTILVSLAFHDNGRARSSYRNPADRVNWITSSRTFAVNLRN